MAWTRNRRRRIKTDRSESGSNDKIETTEKKELKSFLGAIQYSKFLPNLSKQTDRLGKRLKKDEPWKWDRDKKQIGTG